MVEEDKNIKHNKKGFREDTMEKEKTVIFIKEKFIIFIIGFLIGAIVATSGCIIYNKITEKNNIPFAIQNGGNNNQPPGMNDHRNDPNMNGEIQGENPPEREWQNQNDKQKKKEKNNNQQNQMSELDDQNKNGN